MLEGIALRTFVPLLLRAGLAVVFIYHGLGKVRPEANYGMSWMPADHALPGAVQALVAWGELLGGVAIALGLLARVAAVGIIIIMLGAIYTVHLQHGFGLEHGGYEYNFALIIMALCLVLGGAGTMSLDRVIHVKTRGPARY
jgi:putative oxidoreductase